VSADKPAVVHTIRANLTPSLVRLNPAIAEEVDAALKLELPPCDAWTRVNIYKKLLRIVAFVSGRVFIGPELCHDEVYVDAAINFTLDLMAAREAIQGIRPWLRRWKVPFLPEMKKLEQRRAEARAFLQPLINARRKARGDADYQRPDDMLQWLMDNQDGKFGVMGDRELADNQLGLSFAAIHTTTLTSTNAFYNLAVHPEMADVLRDEIKTVLAENGGVFTSAALQSMKKLDSFLKETLRMDPTSLGGFERMVLKPVTLSNGQVLPAGVRIETSAYGVTQDGSVFADPDRFDGLRFYKLREKGAGSNEKSPAVGAAAHNQFVSVSQHSLAFGYGRHACPGRFFAANEVKMIVARVVLEYDIRNVDGIKERYPNVESGNLSLPDSERELLFRKVGGA